MDLEMALEVLSLDARLDSMLKGCETIAHPSELREEAARIAVGTIREQKILIERMEATLRGLREDSCKLRRESIYLHKEREMLWKTVDRLEREQAEKEFDACMENVRKTIEETISETTGDGVKPTLGVAPSYVTSAKRIKELANGISRASERGRQYAGRMNSWAEEIMLHCKLMEEMRRLGE